MSAGAGWMGTMREVLHYLAVVGADQDEHGQYLIQGAPVVSFMGDTSENAECVVPAEAEYLAGGRPCNLAAGLRTTSYGIGGVVIY